MKRVVIVGGGVAGLAAAWRLQQSSPEPLSLLVLEAAPRAGGALQTIAREGFTLELGPDCFISDKPRGVGLCKELSLEQDLIGTRPDKRRSFILRKDTFYPVPEGFYLMGPTRTRPFLESGLLSWPGKFRAMCEPLVPSRRPADESLASFVRRRFGKELLDWMAQPLIAGIYGADPAALSLRATFPKFLEMERTYGSVLLGLKKSAATRAQETASGARYSLFVTLRRGMQTLTDTLAGKLGTSVVRTQTRVKSIRPEGHLWQIVKASGEILTAEALCLALPSYAAAPLIHPFDPDLASDLAAIEYAPAATLNIAFREMDVKRPLDGVGFVVPQKENRLVLGCTFAQNKFEGRVPKGFILMRAFLGGENSERPDKSPAATSTGSPYTHGVSGRWFTETDAGLTDKVLAELRGWLGIIGRPMFSQLQRYELALPLYAVGHLERIFRIEERLYRHPGLALAGNWQHGVGIPDCIESGERAAEALGKELSKV